MESDRTPKSHKSGKGKQVGVPSRTGGLPSQIHGSAQRRPRCITTEEDEEHLIGRSVDDATDESDLELDLKRDDRTITRSEKPKTILRETPHDDAIIYEPRKSPQTPRAVQNRKLFKNNGRDSAAIFEAVHSCRSILLACLDGRTPDALFWKECQARLKDVEYFEKWSSVKHYVLEKMPKQSMPVNRDNLLRHQWRWWWSFWQVKVACHKLGMALSQHFTQPKLMDVLGVKNLDNVTESILNPVLWKAIAARTVKLSEPHSRTRAWSHVPEDSESEEDPWDAEDEFDSSPSLDPNPFPSIEDHGDSGDDTDDAGNCTDSAQEGSVTLDTKQVITIPRSDLLLRLEEYERLITTLQAIIERDPDLMPGSPALGRTQQYVEHEIPPSPLTTSPSTSKSEESIAAGSRTPQSSLPSPGLPPKSLAHILRSPGTPLRSPTIMSKSVPAQSLQDGESDDRNKVPSSSQTCSDTRMSNSEAVTSLGRGVRGQSNPKLREENDKYRQKKKKGSGRGDIQSKVSHIIAQTKIRSVNGIGSQSGSTRNPPSQSLPTGVAHISRVPVHGASDQSPDSDDASEACSLPPLLEIGRRHPGYANSGDGTATRNVPKDLQLTPRVETGRSDVQGSRTIGSTSRRNAGTWKDIEPVSMPTLAKGHEAQNRPSPGVAASGRTLHTGAPSTPSNQKIKNNQVMVSETKKERRSRNRRLSRNAKRECGLSNGGPVRTPTVCTPLAQSHRKRKASSFHGEDAPTPCISPDTSSKKRKGNVQDQDAQPDQARVDTRGPGVASSSQFHSQAQDICAAVVKQMVIQTLNEVFGFDGKDAPEIFRRNLREMIGNGSE